MAQNIIAPPDTVSKTAGDASDIYGKPDSVPSAVQNGEAMLAVLAHLENDAGLYDADCIRPGPYAFACLRELLAQTAQCMRSVFPPGTVYPDGSGALRAEWYHQNREVTLVVFSGTEDRHYIFHKEGKSYAGDYDVTPERLCFYLDWLNDNEPTAN